MLQNKIGGGKPKMRWFFGEHGWPSSSVLPGIPQSDEERSVLIDTLQDWKTAKYQDIVCALRRFPLSALHLLPLRQPYDSHVRA